MDKNMTKEELKEASIEIINQIEDDWLIWQIYRFLINMTK